MFKNNFKLIGLIRNLLCLVWVLNISSTNAQSDIRVNGTTGCPLGGIGAGALKLNANNGTFSIMTRPPADAYDFKEVRNAKFQLWTKTKQGIKTVETLKATTTDGGPADDAIWPLHTVNFGSCNGIQADLCAFSAFDNKQYNNMCLPYAFYEITVCNQTQTTADVAVALQWNFGKDTYRIIRNKGLASTHSAVYAAIDGSKATGYQLSAGGDANQLFRTEGRCGQENNADQASVAVKVSLRPGEKKNIRFVIAWYETVDADLAYYFNLYKDPAAIAQHGLQVFSEMEANATQMVNRFRSSSLPDWLKNQTLNTLANLTTNSMYKKDGRFAFAEGQWTCFGTMDQMWHARQIVGQLLPYFAWQEMHYWARTQMKNGQIHHDLNLMDGNEGKEKRSALVGWDDTEHADYRKIEKWVDLNAAMIISTYEIYQMTGDDKELDYLWPSLKRAANRMLEQVKLYGNKSFPYTFDSSENSYDAGGDPNPFNAGISAVAYKIMTILANKKGEAQLASAFDLAFKTVRKSFEDRYLNDAAFKLSKHCESYYTAQWLALHLKLGEIWSADKTDFVINKLDSYYHPFYRGLGYSNGTYEEWTPYILTHYGGLLLNTKRQDQWAVMQKDAYERQYFNRDLVFNHALNILPKVKYPKWIATNTSSDKQYISLPAIWRNYYDLLGISRDKSTNELWVKPILTSEMKHKMTNALFFTPEGNGTISCKSSGSVDQNKEITVTFDNPVLVSKLYLEDNFSGEVSIAIDGVQMPYTRKGTGYAKELVVELNKPISKNGVKILINGDAGYQLPELPLNPNTQAKNDSVISVRKIDATGVIEAESATKSAGITIEKKGDRTYVTSCNNFDYIQFDNVDFGSKGLTVFTATIASIYTGSTIEVVLDNVAGEVIGNCKVENTGSLTNWEKVSCTISKITGLHDIVLRFSGNNSNSLFDIDNISFKP